MLDGEAASGHGDGFGADGFAAGDVVWRVADDPDAVGREVDAEFFPGARESERAEFVAEMAIVGEGAELEVFPEAEIGELELRALAKIAGKQRLVNLGMVVDGVECLANAGENACLARRQRERHVGKVSAAEARFLLEAMRHVEKREQVARDRGVGAAAQVDGQLLSEVAAVEFLDREQERALAGAVHVDQRAVDVPEDE